MSSHYIRIHCGKIGTYIHLIFCFRRLIVEQKIKTLQTSKDLSKNLESQSKKAILRDQEILSKRSRNNFQENMRSFKDRSLDFNINGFETEMRENVDKS